MKGEGRGGRQMECRGRGRQVERVMRRSYIRRGLDGRGRYSKGREGGRERGREGRREGGEESAYVGNYLATT